MRVVQVPSWDDFVEKTDALSGWAFRGEVSAQWPLVTAIARRLTAYCPDPVLWPLRESRALRVFRRKAHNYLSDSSGLSDDLRCLALMQHHGAPTRLLDFTKSPYVAAFFALENALDESAVYALNTPQLWSAAPFFDPGLTREVIDPRIQGNYERYFLRNTNPVVWVGEPSEMDRRLVSQSGLFVMPGQIQKTLGALLESYDHGSDLLVKYVLPLTIRSQAMQALYRMNITYATLFPDLEGLAISSAYELEVVWESLVQEYLAKSTEGGQKPMA